MPSSAPPSPGLQARPHARTDAAWTKDKWLCVAEIAAPHGVRGLIRLRVHLEAPENLAQYNPLKAGAPDGNAVTVELKSPLKRRDNIWVASIAGLKDRTAAEKWRGTKFFVPRTSLAGDAPLEDNTYHAADLENLRVFKNSEDIGRVRSVENYGAGDLLRIQTHQGEEFFLPFNVYFVPKINILEDFLEIEDEEQFRTGSEGAEL